MYKIIYFSNCKPKVNVLFFRGCIKWVTSFIVTLDKEVYLTET